MEAIESVILLDVPDGGGEFARSFLESTGHATIICHGPAHATLCPILRHDGSCPKVEEAHGVVFQLDLDRPQHRAILARYQEILHEDVPIGVIVKAGQDEQYAEELGNVHVWVKEPSVGQLDGFAAEVDAADRVMQ